MAGRAYKIQLISSLDDQQVDFGPRQLGQIGRDILIVKKALGAIVDYSSLVHEGDNNPSLESPDGFFDCASAEKVSDLQAATFDRNMQRYLIKYQQDNQFYIMSYLFSKIALQTDIDAEYGFAQKIADVQSPFVFEGGGFISTIITNLPNNIGLDYSKSNFASTQTAILQSLWAREFGTLGEATLAVLHGWRPRSKVGNTSYYHDDNIISEDEHAYDLSLLGLCNSFLSGHLTQKPADTEDLVNPKNAEGFRSYMPVASSDPGNSFYEKYKDQVSTSEDVLSINQKKIDGYTSKLTFFCSLKYNRVPKGSRSVLYSTLESTPAVKNRPEDVSMLSDEDFTKFSQRSIEPNPQLDPDPFIIDNHNLGYFMPTDYTISPVNLPPKQGDEDYISIIRNLEDQALSKIIRFYNKPDVWFLDPESAIYTQVYQTDLTDRRANHDGTYHGLPSVFVLTTSASAELGNIMLTDYNIENPEQPLDPLGAAENYNRIEYIDRLMQEVIESDNGPLIKFVEFVTPSLRPGDVYRAKFIVNRKKFSLIEQGLFIDVPLEETTTPPSDPPSSGYSTTTVEDTLGTNCENGPLTDLELENRYNEYLALAERNRREIVRAFREASFESYDNKQAADAAIVDLGVIGNTSLRFDTDSEGFGAQILSGLSSGIGSFYGGRYTLRNAEAQNPLVQNMGDINKDFKFFAEDVRRASRNLKEASENCSTSQITFSPPFTGQTEVDNMNAAIEDLKNIISVVIPDYNFGESKGSRNAGDTFLGDASASNDNTTIDGLFGGADSIRITFSPSTTGAGLRIDTIMARDTYIIEARDTKTPTHPRAKALLDESKALNRSRTVAYLAQSNAMAFGDGFWDGVGDWALSGAECLQGFGFGKKGLAFIMKFTPALKGNVPEQYNPISRYTEAVITGATDRAKEWWTGQTDNFTSQVLEAEFGVDETLDLFGPECTDYRELLMDFVYHFSPGKLLCDYARCLNIPAIRLEIPDFNLPGRPDLSIFGWYKGLVAFLMDQWRQILNRILCSFVKMILEYLKSPWPVCGQHLKDELFGSAAAASPIMKQAFTDALTETFLSEESVKKAPELIDDMGKILTGEELCRILQGGPIDGPTMNMLLKIAKKVGIEEVNTEETLRRFFETISFFIPESMCEELSQVTEILGSSSCEETSSYLDQIRRQMLANNATDEEIRHALDMADKNMMSEATALEALMRGGLQATMPNMVDFSDPGAILNKLPENLMTQLASSSKDIFSAAKKGYVSSLSAFSPALFLNSSRLPRPSDPEYNEEASIIVETISENLKLLSLLSEKPTTLQNLTERLHVLYQVYETTEYKDTGKKVLQSYDVGFLPVGKIPQDFAVRYNNDSKVDYDDRGNYSDVFGLALNPVGVSQDAFIIDSNRPQDYTRATRIIGLNSSSSKLADFRFVYRYKIAKNSEVEKAEQSLLLELISERLGELQGILENYLQAISTPVNYDGYLDIIKQIISVSYENSLEQIRSTREMIEDTTPGAENQTISLSANLGPVSANINLLEFKSPESTNSSVFDPYAITIGSGPLFRSPQTFEYCDTIPGPGLDEASITPDQEEERQLYENAISDIPPGLYTRRELFTRKYWDSIRNAVDLVYDNPESARDRQGLDQINNWSSAAPGADFIRRYFYGKDTLAFSEGIFEQIFFSLENSRMFDEENYYPELKRKVNGEVYLDVEQGCYKNKYNVSQFGILSFEKMVTDELDSQIRKEMAKPENRPENLDFDDLGPIEKAIQNVALVGFVRVCLVELLLKGSIAYSVWDIESISDEPFFQDFVYRFIFEQLEGSKILDGKWKEIIERVMGIEQPKAALKKLVVTQIFQVQDSCKKIFNNSKNVDYYNWFITSFVPQTDVSRIVSSGNLDELNFRRDPITNEVVDLEGNPVSERDRILNEIPESFYWQHPLYDQNLNNEFLEGKKNFFHIEHLLEVRGPLARLESIILPNKELYLSFLEADAETAPENFMTNVSRQYRNVRRLNVAQALLRFGIEIDINDYKIEEFELPGSARGTTAEDADAASADFEVYHVKDFVQGIRSLTAGEDINKLLNHLAGVMAYEPGREEYDGKYTPYPSADGMPESIRRTPTKFITKYRTIINFTKDFVTQPIKTIRDQHQAYYEGLHKYGLSDNLSPTEDKLDSPLMVGDFVLGDEDGNVASNLYANEFSQYVEREDREAKYYILPSNGEEYLHLLNDLNDGDLEAATQSPEFFSLVAEDNNHKYMNYSGYRFFAPQIVRTAKASLTSEDIRIAPAAPRTPGGLDNLRGQTFGHDLEGEYASGPGDDLSHDYDPDDASAPRRVYTNPIGKIRNEQIYNNVKQVYTEDDLPLYTEEIWAETVFTFTDTASLIVGLHGSFSIGETQDPSVMNFVPSQDLIDSFNEALLNVTRLHGQDGSDNAFVELGTADAKLTQTDRVLYAREYNGTTAPFLARPMGIDRSTNVGNTSYWTCATGRGRTKSSKFYSPELSSISQNNIVSRRRKGKVLLHQIPSISRGAGNVATGFTYESDNVLPANFYKIPLRVLVTRVFDPGSVSPKEVYCRVVPPEYIRNINKLPFFADSPSLRPDGAAQQTLNSWGPIVQENMEKLNVAVSSIMNEYNEFVSQTRSAIGETIQNTIAGYDAEDALSEEEEASLAGDIALGLTSENIRSYPGFEQFPDLTTDFTRDHLEDEKTLWSTQDPNLQFCSIERIYSKIFEQETENINFNSDEELDRLFANRGKLMHNNEFAHAPAEPMDNSGASFYYDSWSLPAANTTYRNEINEYCIKRDRLRSFHFMYDIVDFYPFGTTRDFHRTTFSLANILEDYISSRRSDTLWGHTSRQQTTGNDQVITSTIVNILGGTREINAVNNRAELDAFVDSSPWSQAIPITLSYSDKFHWQARVFSQNHHGHRRAGYKKLSPYTIWTMNPLPRKNALQYWRINDDAEWGSADEIDAFQATYDGESLESPWIQPGFCTIFPGSGSIEDIAFPDDDVIAPSYDYRDPVIQYIHVVPSNDFHPPSFIRKGSNARGLQIDGPGYKNVNYNKIETNFLKEMSTSLYKNNGEVSFLDISILIESTVSYIINEVTGRDETLPSAVFDYRKFISSSNQSDLYYCLGLYSAEGQETLEQAQMADFVFDIQVGYLKTSVLPGALSEDDKFFITNGMSKEYVIGALEWIEGAIRSMYYESANSASFCVQSEYTAQNEYILSSTYKLFYLHRFLHTIIERSEEYSTPELLYLLSIAGRPNFAKTLMSRHTASSRGNVQDWIQYIYDNSLKPGSSLPERMMTNHEVEVVRTGKIYDFFTKLDKHNYRKTFTGQFIRRYMTLTLGIDPTLDADFSYSKISSAALLTQGEALEHQIEPYLEQDQALGILRGREALINKHADQYRRAFETYSGISANFLRNALLDLSSNSDTISGLFSRSEIKQVSRLVANSYLMPDKPSNENLSNDASILASVYANFVNGSNPIQKASEEFRSYVMYLPDEEKSRYLSVPVSNYSEILSEFGSSDFSCIDFNTFERDFNRRKAWMAQELINNNDSKQIFNYIYPVKRYQSISTVFVTSMLAGYGGMTRVMQSPKASLIFLMLATGMSPAERLGAIDELSQVDLYKAMLDNPTSNFDEFTCADIFPGLFSGIFEDFWTRLGELILLFPAILFRGMASVVDPAYKEMKLHWDNCDIDKLKWSAVRWGSSLDGDIVAGLDKQPDGERNGQYSAIVPAFPVDLGKSIMALRYFQTGPLKETMKRFLGYIYKGPIALVDGAFVFQIPCAQDDPNQWPDEEFQPWNFGRYGHPISPLTALALTFQELPGDIRQREMSGCGEADYSREAIEANPECPNNAGEQKPFGDMPVPEE